MEAPADPSVTPRRALLVDDEDVIRLALRRFFQRQGWQVDEAEDGAAALDFVVGPAAATYDVILTDLLMPGMSGKDFYARIAEARPELLPRVIVSTGNAMAPEAFEFLRRTGCPVLNKPFELAELRALIARVTGAA
jgi:two-component system NtrC family sensor kinase